MASSTPLIAAGNPVRAVLDALSRRPNVCLFTAITFQIVVCIAALVLDARMFSEYHVYFDSTLSSTLVIGVFMFVLLASLFLLADFGIGYVLSYQFYLMVGGFLWINYFTHFKYDHTLAGFSAAVSGIAFLLPALFLKIRLPRVELLSRIYFQPLLYGLLAIALITLLFASVYHLEFVGLGEADAIRMRGDVRLPAAARYATGIASGALLPFAFACFVLRKQYVLAALTIILLACFYPITVSKTAFFAPVWLVFVALVCRVFEPKLSLVIALLVPMLFGVVSTLFPVGSESFRLLDHRMYVVPANALAIYNEFFSHNQPTHFCQINLVRVVFGCPYEDLGPVLRDVYQQGNYYASLFATEGIASVGAKWAAIPVFACAVVVALADAAGRHLPRRLVMLSSSLLWQIFLDTPFSVTLLSYGALILFVLWYLTPSEAEWI